MNTFRFIDLFCGIGGFRQAMESVGGTCVFSCDKNKNVRLTYEANYGEVPEKNIVNIKASDIPSFDVLCAGFPCQPFSLAGKQKGFDDTKRGTMFFEIVRIINHHMPKVVFLENVDNLLKHDSGSTFRVIKETMEESGYTVHYKVLTAYDYGVPQIRKRIYIVCFRNDLKADFQFPEPFRCTTAVEDFLDMEVDEHYFLDSGLVTLYKEDLDTRLDRSYRIGCLGEPIEKRRIGQGQRIYSVKGYTPTFVATSRRFGPCGHTETYLVNGRVRMLTPHEAVRILGFPDDFIFPVAERRAYEMIGNSVAVPVLKAVVRQIMETGIFEKKELP